MLWAGTRMDGLVPLEAVALVAATLGHRWPMNRSAGAS